jgi:tRNA pseudouridine55 synthase
MSQLNGILLIDKPTGMTSHDVVARVRRILGTRAVGHCGTLDPLASGLMILLIGQATKISDYLLLQAKTYETTVQLGLTTDSFDVTGAETSRSDLQMDFVAVTTAVGELTGDLTLAVPVFSATKVDGKKLYEYARSGQEVVLPVKIMSFFDVKVNDYSYPDVRLTLSCSKGSFIRAWAAELGKRLGVGGCVKTLRRLQSYPWSVERAITLEALQELKDSANLKLDEKVWGTCFVPLAEALPHLKTIVADGWEQKLLKNGQIPHSLSTRLTFELKQVHKQGEVLGIRVISTTDRALIAILQAIPGQGLKIRRVFPAV